MIKRSSAQLVSKRCIKIQPALMRYTMAVNLEIKKGDTKSEV